MNRRAFVTGLGALRAVLFGAGAQPPVKVYRISYLRTTPLTASSGVIRKIAYTAQ